MLPNWQGQFWLTSSRLGKEVVVQTVVTSCAHSLKIESPAQIMTVDGRGWIWGWKIILKNSVDAVAATCCVILFWWWSCLLWRLLTCSVAAPSFAKVSAVSLPSTLQWEGIHCKTTVSTDNCGLDRGRSGQVTCCSFLCGDGYPIVMLCVVVCAAIMWHNRPCVWTWWRDLQQWVCGQSSRCHSGLLGVMSSIWQHLL